MSSRARRIGQYAAAPLPQRASCPRGDFEAVADDVDAAVRQHIEQTGHPVTVLRSALVTYGPTDELVDVEPPAWVEPTFEPRPCTCGALTSGGGHSLTCRYWPAPA